MPETPSQPPKPASIIYSSARLPEQDFGKDLRAWRGMAVTKPAIHQQPRPVNTLAEPTTAWGEDILTCS